MAQRESINGRLTLWLAMLSICLVWGCAGPQDRERELAQRCARISNRGIRWDGTDFGLHPWVEGVDEKWLIETPLDAEPYLLQALDDPDRWIVAHVILTNRWSRRTDKGFFEGVTCWNGMELILHGDGTIRVEPGEQAKIREIWTQALQGGKDPFEEGAKQAERAMAEWRRSLQGGRESGGRVSP